MRHRIYDMVTGVRPSELRFETRQKAIDWLVAYQVSEAYKDAHYRIVPEDPTYPPDSIAGREERGQNLRGKP